MTMSSVVVRLAIDVHDDPSSLCERATGLYGFHRCEDHWASNASRITCHAVQFGSDLRLLNQMSWTEVALPRVNLDTTRAPCYIRGNCFTSHMGW